VLDGLFNRRRQFEVTPIGELTVDDSVVVYTPERVLLGASLRVYLLPLLIFFMVALAVEQVISAAGSVNDLWASWLGICLGFASALWALKSLGRRAVMPTAKRDYRRGDVQPLIEDLL
jgi:positive regulator of sigma E activity